MTTETTPSTSEEAVDARQTWPMTYAIASGLIVMVAAPALTLPGGFAGRVLVPVLFVLVMSALVAAPWAICRIGLKGKNPEPYENVGPTNPYSALLVLVVGIVSLLIGSLTGRWMVSVMQAVASLPRGVTVVIGIVLAVAISLLMTRLAQRGTRGKVAMIWSVALVIAVLSALIGWLHLAIGLTIIVSATVGLLLATSYRAFRRFIVCLAAFGLMAAFLPQIPWSGDISPSEPVRIEHNQEQIDQLCADPAYAADYPHECGDQ